MIALTHTEKSILNDLATAWNKYVDLKQKHPMEEQEFASAIHLCQYIIAKRVAERVDPDFF